MNRYRWYAALVATCISTAVLADDRDEYNRRSAERFIAMFRMNDVNRDDVVSREEATGTIELVARFDDVDVNRDGNISWDELTRFIDGTFR